MPLYEPPEGRPNSLAITPFSAEAMEFDGLRLQNASTNPADGGVTANLLFAYPVSITEPYRIRRFFIVNGSLTMTGNIDIGVYDEAFVRLVSTGATAQAGAGTLQQIAADYTLNPGRYYIACSPSSGSSSFHRYVSVGNVGKTQGCWQQSNAHPLPATATPATWTNGTMLIFGISRLASY
jgi:hypothetical protein